MLRFAVFDIPNDDETLWRSAYAIGHDGAAIHSDITCRDGFVEIRLPTEESYAFALQWDCGSLGTLTLQTCLLPQTDEPYLLSLELARHRCMLFLTKLEDWGRTDTDPEAPEMRRFAQAQRRFMDALVNARARDGRYDRNQDTLAREALELALDASELLALTTAEPCLEHRLQMASTDDTTTPAILGCTINPGRFTEPLQQVIAEHFGFVVVPLNWSSLEPEEGRLNFKPTDRWIEWAVRKAHLPVTAGPVLDLSPNATPEWIYIWEHDYETLREIVYEHVKRVVTRYRRAVSKWNICCGLHLNTNLTLTLEQVIDLTRLVVLVTRKLHPRSKIQVEIDQPFGETPALSEHSIPPLLYAEILTQTGIDLDSFGLRVQIGDAQLGKTSRDLMQISSLLDQYASYEKPISISLLGAPSELERQEHDPEMGELAMPVNPGSWRGPWSEQIQAEWMTRAISIALAKSYVTSISWQDLYDTGDHPHMPFGGLVTSDGRPKLALGRMLEIRKQLHSGHALGPLITSTGQSATSVC
ncbi:MAG: endo-1,4-beta-xylanase [Phycisphaerales bacterium JB043]